MENEAGVYSGGAFLLAGFPARERQ
jgi:hypothetical protein